MHDAHHAAPIVSDNPDESQAQHAVSPHVTHSASGAMSHSDSDSADPGKCCSGMCVSVVLQEYGNVFAERITTRKYVALHEQTASLEASGFLRPPKHLI